MEITEYMLANKPIIEGTWNDDLKTKFQSFKKYADESKLFFQFHEKQNMKEFNYRLMKLTMR